MGLLEEVYPVMEFISLELVRILLLAQFLLVGTIGSTLQSLRYLDLHYFYVRYGKEGFLYVLWHLAFELTKDPAYRLSILHQTADILLEKGPHVLKFNPYFIKHRSKSQQAGFSLFILWKILDLKREKTVVWSILFHLPAYLLNLSGECSSFHRQVLLR